MFKKCLAAALVLLVGCTAFEEPPQGDLRIDLNSNYRIVVPDRFDSPGCKQGVQQAAEMLQRAFRAAVGWNFPIIPEHVARRAPGRSVYLGNCAALRKLGVDPARFGAYDYVILENNGDICIAGNDRRRPAGDPRSPEGCVLGTVKGATAFAEEFLGTRFLYPGEVGTEYAPKPGTVTIPRPLARRVSAPLAFAAGRSYALLYDYANNNYGPGFLDETANENQNWDNRLELARRTLEKHPEKKLLFPAAHPPRNVAELPPNVIVELDAGSPRIFTEWRHLKVPGGFVIRLRNWGSTHLPGFTPKRTPEFVAGQLRRFRAAGVKGVRRCGFGENFGLEGPVYYTFGKLLDHPERDPRAIVREFCRGAFGESAAPMERFYEALYARLALFSRLEGADGGGATALPEDPAILLGMIYTPDLLARLEKELGQAEKLARQVNVRKRLMLVRLEFSYAKNLGRIIVFHNACRIAPTRENRERLARELEFRNELIRTVAAHSRDWCPNWSELPVFGGTDRQDKLLKNGNSTPLGAPFNLNPKTLREKRIPHSKMRSN